MSKASPNPPWQSPPPSLTLQEGELHIWRLRFSRAVHLAERLAATLNDEERDRAARFHFPAGQQNYVIARGALRDILSRYLAVAATDLAFSYNSRGKPLLNPESGYPPLRFNLAHSGDLALYAVNLGKEVGIDVEQFRPNFAGQRIAERFFSPREAHALRCLPGEKREEGFFNCWTRKEAYIKARGEGLSFPLDAFDVSLAPGEPAALLRTHGEPEEASRWSLFALETAPGYAAAVAVEGRGWTLIHWDWE